MTKGIGRTLALACAACALLAALSPAEGKKNENPAPPPPATGGMTKAGEEALPKSVVDEMARYTSPGPQHQELSAFAGKWTTRTRVWENPEAKPVEFTGSAESKMILGGRFLELESRAVMNGTETRGLGIYGYDAFKEKYSFYYIHDSETQALAGLGDRDSASGAITFSVAMDMPLAGEHAKAIRAVLRRSSASRYLFEMYEKYIDDREWKVLEIAYDRGR